MNRRSMNQRIGPAAHCDGEKEEKGGDDREDDRDDHCADPSSPQTDQLGPHLVMILMIIVLMVIILMIIGRTLLMVFVVIILLNAHLAQRTHVDLMIGRQL